MEISVQGQTLYYETYGNGFPILFLHGYLLDNGVMIGAFEPIFKHIEGFQRIYVDMPGMGYSEPLKNDPTSDHMLSVIDGFIGQVIGNQSFAVTGFSYGTYIARGLLHKRFDQIQGLFLFAPVIRAANSERKMMPEPVVFVGNPEAMSQVPEPMRSIFERNCVIQTDDILQRVQNEIVPAFSRSNFEFLEILRQEQNYQFSFEVDELPETFTKPTVFLAGRQDSSVGFAGALDLLPQYPRATYAVLDRAGHNLHMEQDYLFNGLVMEWIARLHEEIHGMYNFVKPSVDTVEV